MIYFRMIGFVIGFSVIFVLPDTGDTQPTGGPTISKDVGVGPGIEATAQPAILKNVGIEQKIGTRLPLDLKFTDESGALVELSQYFGNKPIILSLVYYDCPMLCTEVLNGINRTTAPLKLSIGEDFEMISISFDPNETHELASQKKKIYVRRNNRPGAAEGWHFLTGNASSIEAITDAVGFNYVYDETEQQFVHGSAIMVVTPKGIVSHYFFGIEYPTDDLRLALVEASENKLGTVYDQVLLYCFHYDPTRGKYGVVIMNVIRLAGVGTLLVMGSFMFVMFRRDRRAKNIGPTSTGTA
ncbi:MAG: SCO family protein [Candidatus Latescibacteria bacterium]|jgi:protein SCO1/2|nr:SCO family protein [Candidatus Latescibacterota bacterium]